MAVGNGKVKTENGKLRVRWLFSVFRFPFSVFKGCVVEGRFPL